MTDLFTNQRRRLRSLDREGLRRYQLERLNQLLAVVLPSNRFYSQRLGEVPLPLDSLEQLDLLPFTHKHELAGDGDAPFAANRTYPIDHYVRYHRTSGTSGQPMGICDTSVDWLWWIETWQYVLDAAEVTARDVAVLAFSFGPFIGFWSANDALAHRGAIVVPTGGMSTSARLACLLELDAAVVCCTPSYALHMAEIADQENLDLAASNVRALIVAGEPGGSIPSTRQRIEQAWGARVVDHAGATEIGPWGYGTLDGTALRIIESEFIAEFMRPSEDVRADDGAPAELILTTLGRSGAPVIRYRTGDLVQSCYQPSDEDGFVKLSGGVIGRVDDMVIVRGVNVFPASIEGIIREFGEIVEYRAIVEQDGNLNSLRVEIEMTQDVTSRVAEQLRTRLGLSVSVDSVPTNTLPRFQGKGKRFFDQRSNPDPQST